MSFPGARRVAGWLFWVVFPLLCLVALWFAISGIIGHIGNQPAGVRGNYVANRSCSHGICLVGGTFVSDDGKLRVTSLLGDPRWPDGSEHRVVYDGKSVEVLAISTWDPTTSVIAGVGALTYLGVVGFFVRSMWLSGRASGRLAAVRTSGRLAAVRTSGRSAAARTSGRSAAARRLGRSGRLAIFGRSGRSRRAGDKQDTESGD